MAKEITLHEHLARISKLSAKNLTKAERTARARAAARARWGKKKKGNNG